MKKIICLIMAVALAAALMACGKTAEPETKATEAEVTTQAQTAGGEETQAETAQGEETQTEEPTTEKQVELNPYKIAVAFTQINATALAQQEYLEKYVGPAFNVEFMFSEAVDSADVAMTFIENAYAAGCDAIMNFQNSSVEQINAKANEVGMYIVSNSPAAENDDLPYVVGHVHGAVEDSAAAYKHMVEDFTSDGEDHNVVIISAGAGLGNSQHYECTYAMLEVLQDKYGLSYNDSIENLASSRGMTQVETGTDMKILLYPGYPNSDTYVSGLSAELQSGEYDLVLGCNQATTNFAVAIDEVERAYNFNVKVGYFTSIDDAATSAVTTIDSFGNPSVDSFVINPGDILVGAMFASLYNAISGNPDCVRTNGVGTDYFSPIWVADPDTYLKLTELNHSEDTLEMSIDDIKDLLYIYNEDVTPASFQDKLYTLLPDTILEARGLK